MIRVAIREYTLLWQKQSGPCIAIGYLPNYHNENSKYPQKMFYHADDQHHMNIIAVARSIAIVLLLV